MSDLDKSIRLFLTRNCEEMLSKEASREKRVLLVNTLCPSVIIVDLQSPIKCSKKMLGCEDHFYSVCKSMQLLSMCLTKNLGSKSSNLKGNQRNRYLLRARIRSSLRPCKPLMIHWQNHLLTENQWRPLRIKEDSWGHIANQVAVRINRLRHLILMKYRWPISLSTEEGWWR